MRKSRRGNPLLITVYVSTQQRKTNDCSLERCKSGKKPKKVGHIKMVVIPDAKAKTINAVAGKSVREDSSVRSDGTASHADPPSMFKEYVGSVIDKADIGKVLPWVHIAIANAKTLLADIYHGVRREFLHEYLNEFCYKFNRRYFGDRLFGRLLIAATAYVPAFKHRVYNSRLGMD